MSSKIAYAADPARGWRPWGALVPFLGIAFVAMTVASLQVLLEHMHLIDAQENPVGLLGFVAFLVGPFGALAAVTLAWVRFVERRSFASIGLAPGRPFLTLAQGHLVGDVMMASIVAGIWIAGGMTAGGFAPAFASLTSLASIALLLVGFVVQAGTEELLFRGWMLSAVAAKFGTMAGVVVSSLVFTLLHFDPHAPVLFSVNVFLFAVFACAWALRTGNIWGVMGWHAGWNWLLGVGFGLRVTGLDTHMPALLVKLTQSGPVFLTGGAQGCEGSTVCTAVLLGGIECLARENERNCCECCMIARMKLHALVVGLTFAASLTGALAGMPSLSEVRAALSRAHFSYLMNRDEVTLRRIGEIKTDHRRYCIVYYVWDESWRHAHERGGFPHAAHRLLVFERAANSLKYLGLYNVSAAPVSIRGNTILFDTEDGNKLVFGADGPPPTAMIDGEIPDFDTKP